MASLLSLVSGLAEVYARQSLARKSEGCMSIILMKLMAWIFIITGGGFGVFALYDYLLPILGLIYTNAAVGGGFAGLGVILLSVFSMKKPKATPVDAFKNTAVDTYKSSLNSLAQVGKNLGLHDLKLDKTVAMFAGVGISVVALVGLAYYFKDNQNAKFLKKRLKDAF